MGQATSTGGMLLVSMLLLACNHERVDLGGAGASGSAPLPVAGSAGAVPQTPAPSDEPTPPIVVRRPSSQTKPGNSSGFTLSPSEPSPLFGVPSRAYVLPPIGGGSLAVAADGSSAVAADPDRDALYLIDLQSNAVRTLTLPAGSEPGRVALDDRGQAYVVLRSASKLARVQLNTAKLDLSEPICQYPRGLAYSAMSHTLQVACADGQLVKLNADTFSVAAREQYPDDLRDVLLDATDTPVVSHFRSAGLSWRGRDGAVVEGKPVDLSRPTVDLSAPSDSQVRSISTRAKLAFRTLAAPDGTLWMLHERAQLDVLKADVYSGADPVCGPVMQPALTHFSAGNQPTYLEGFALHGLVAPAVDLAISPDGRWIAIATPAAYAQRRSSVQLHMFDALKKQAVVQPPPMDNEFPKLPSEVCRPAGFVGLADKSQAVAVAFDRNNVLYIQNRFPARLDIIRAVPMAGSTDNAPATEGERQIILNDTDMRDLGHEWFHAALGDSRLSCAACHAEGLDDAHTWQFNSKGLRRTPSLRGGLLQTAPFAWDGEFSSAEALIAQLSQDRLDFHNLPADVAPALGQWLDKLPALSLPATPAAASGKLLFESAELSCSSCHSGPQLTNNQTVDVGTGGAFQVPSLLGLGLRAPYMHDGCAEDLSALFTQPECARQGHAQLKALSDAQAADLQAYLHSL